MIRFSQQPSHIESGRGRLLATKHGACGITMYAEMYAANGNSCANTSSHTSIAQWKWNSFSLMSIRKTYLWPFFGWSEFSKRLNSLEEFNAAPHTDVVSHVHMRFYSRIRNADWLAHSINNISYKLYVRTADASSVFVIKSKMMPTVMRN